MIKCATDKVQKKLEETIEFAKKMGLWNHGPRCLKRELFYLASYANRRGCTYDRHQGSNTRATLFDDFAPWSFTFIMQKKPKGWDEFNYWFQGGLIYQGPDCPNDGSAPAFTVSLDRFTGWSVHT